MIEALVLVKQENWSKWCSRTLWDVLFFGLANSATELKVLALCLICLDFKGWSSLHF